MAWSNKWLYEVSCQDLPVGHCATVKLDAMYQDIKDGVEECLVAKIGEDGEEMDVSAWTWDSQKKTKKKEKKKKKKKKRKKKKFVDPRRSPGGGRDPRRGWEKGGKGKGKGGKDDQTGGWQQQRHTPRRWDKGKGKNQDGKGQQQH